MAHAPSEKKSEAKTGILLDAEPASAGALQGQAGENGAENFDRALETIAGLRDKGKEWVKEHPVPTFAASVIAGFLGSRVIGGLSGKVFDRVRALRGKGKA